jgi:V/A-type H+/Na+-transporting ATPase subunit E
VTVKDGVSAIASEVLGDVQKEAEAILLAAENNAKETLKKAKEQATQTYKTIISQATANAETEKRKIASVAEVEMRNRLLQTKEDLVDVAFEKARLKLEYFVTTKEYQNYLLNLIKIASKRIGQKKLVVQINNRDEEWLTQDMLKNLSNKLSCDLTLSDRNGSYIGGCIIQTADNKIFYDVTIDNRLQEFKPILRVEIAKILFGEGK